MNFDIPVSIGIDLCLNCTFSQVREKVMQYLRQEAHQKAFQDVVKEDTLPPFMYVIRFRSKQTRLKKNAI